tara:strand:- start:847 stop:1344 length:498 start_codon:yes stop_codon:yes gene_type:complete
MSNVEILLEDNRWANINLEKLVGNAFYQTLLELGYSKSDFSLSVLACSDKKMKELNHTFCSKDTSTNVLSWPSRERLAFVEGNHPLRLDPALDAELGDIALSYDTCLEEATQSKINFAFHVQHLIIHGILHLLGYDHSSYQDATLMEDLERQILGNLNLKPHTQL